MHISRLSLRLVALGIAVVGALYLGSTLAPFAHEYAHAQVGVALQNAVTCSDIYLDVDQTHTKGTPHDPADIRVGKSMSRLETDGAGKPQALYLVTYLNPGISTTNPIGNKVVSADTCIDKAIDGKAGPEANSLNPTVKFQIHDNNRLPITPPHLRRELKGPDTNLIADSCVFSEATGEWSRTATDVLIANVGPNLTNFGLAQLHVGTTSPAATVPGKPNIALDPTTCLDTGDTLVFQAVVETRSRNPTTDDTTQTPKIPLDPDGTSGAPPIPQPQPPDGDTLADDWDGDGCTDWDELGPIDGGKGGGADPFNQTDCSNNPAGLYNVLATVLPASKDAMGNVLPGIYFHCIAKVDKAGSDLTGAAQCYTDAPALAALPPISAVPSREDGLAGAPPPPPYTNASPGPLTGSYDSMNEIFDLNVCFRNIGAPLGPNVHAHVTVDATTLKGTLQVWLGLSAKDCQNPYAKPPKPEDIAGVVQLARQKADFDHDQDGCSDADELNLPLPVGKCGDDPYNPEDSDSNYNSISDVLVTVAEADVGGSVGTKKATVVSIKNKVTAGGPYDPANTEDPPGVKGTCANGVDDGGDTLADAADPDCYDHLSATINVIQQVPLVVGQNVYWDTTDQLQKGEWHIVSINTVPDPDEIVMERADPDCSSLAGLPGTDATAPGRLLATTCDGAVTPGAYFHCKAENQHNKMTNAITSRLFCYVDNPGIEINPLGFPGRFGDGLAGAPPPGLTAADPPGLPSTYAFADMDSTHTQLNGSYNPGPNTITISGCFQGVDGVLGPTVYTSATFSVHTGVGTADIFIGQTPANCKAGTPVGAPLVGTLQAVEQFSKTGATAPNQWDSDLDGCTDKQELRNGSPTGGLRDPYNEWDFMDQYTGAPLAKDRIVAVGDIGAVVGRFGSSGTPGSPSATPSSPAGYHSSADRSGAIPGSNGWNLKGADGIVSIGDVGSTVAQFGHSCTT
ncbi:MAG: flexitail domain-containing putative surface protein [Dehalococcoidia bacterium]